MKEKTFGAQVWAGKPRTIDQARAKYAADPTTLVGFASTLYSFRYIPSAAEELLELRLEIVRQANENLVRTAVDESNSLKIANEADVLATVLAWMSRRPELGTTEQQKAHDMAVRLCRHGIAFASDLEQGHHTPELLRLTLAELRFANGKVDAGQSLLSDVECQVLLIKDAKQRTRVMRKLGALQRRHAQWRRGVYWGIRACTVPGVPMAVRLKSAAALFGINR